MDREQIVDEVAGKLRALIADAEERAAQIVADLTALIQAIMTPMRSATWILPSKTAATIAARLAGVGTTTTLPTPLLGLPAIVRRAPRRARSRWSIWRASSTPT